jgi:cytochrome c biogenesis protein CcmG/thiol:disulfide interchange protein DsbE
MRKLRVWLPLLVLSLLAVMFARGLQLDPRKLPSTRVGQMAPAFSLPLLEGAGAFSPESMRGRVWVLNVFASWCGACITEHPRLLALAAQQKVDLVGLAYKDAPQDSLRWLAEHGGNPYRRVAVDRDGRVGIDYGVYGVPETFVIDASGTIRYRHVGPIDETFFATYVAPLLTTP